MRLIKLSEHAKSPVFLKELVRRQPTTSSSTMRAEVLVRPPIVMYWISWYAKRMRKLPFPEAPNVKLSMHACVSSVTRMGRLQELKHSGREGGRDPYM